MKNKDAYIAEMKSQLDALNATMHELEAKVALAQADMRAKYEEEVAKLRHQSTLAQAKLDELRASSEASWTTLVAGTEKVRDAFVHSFHYLKSQL
ncbi:hypothetical protein [Janthinobacterium sp.]|uniref:hypothetical protein n=1 Tax=Janthinobacterium sp. TaxID=1871054 RepID=UPI00293D1FF6|nr:hypothetical protein [Janthinobacterium sp.]